MVESSARLSRHSETILEAYEQSQSLYRDFAAKLEALVRDLLVQEGIAIHSTSSRGKTLVSLRRKLARKGGSYTSLDAVTDLAGVRVITFFAEDVDRVAAMILREFEIDSPNTIDKRQSLDPDRFGYLSLHHVMTLGPSRQELTEYRRFPNLKAEIQTRSILQHAWAEIEHDLGYKTVNEVPREIRRRFSRVAGLLELADQEFETIRLQLDRYSASVPSVIERDPDVVSIDSASIEAFVSANQTVARIDQELAQLLGQPELEQMEYPEAHVANLTAAGLSSIGDVKAALELHSARIVAFAERWLAVPDEPGDEGPKTFASGVCLFYLAYVLVVGHLDKDRIVDYLKSVHIAPREDSWRVADQLIKTFMEVEANSGV